MDVLIKNMTMPKERIMLEIFPNGRVLEINPHNNARIPTEAEAIKLPPHGRLIDAVALKGSIEGRILAGQGVNVFGEIDNAPTIVEASNGSDN